MFLLDTNICIYIVNKHPQNIIQRIETYNPIDIKISTISVAEMEYGVAKSKMREKNRTALMNFISNFEIIPFELKDAEIYGIIRAELEQKGKIIGAYDIQLAAQALSRDYIFVTNNTKEFNRIKKLRLENWV
ncbi:MAG: type II toxin-antitoxin system VapC family toxin [Treponema sp.]|jgi:tRNA(fMet)-specific endonuclease VapC|nr:type II toxin-antitoxin system VapC family toxin [Treponema sp.]